MRRIGEFSISDGIDEDSPEVRAILARCDVLCKKPNPWHCSTKYLADSLDFDPVDMGEEIPRYDWMIHTKPDGSFTVEAKRQVPDPEMQARIAKLLEGVFD